MLNADGRLQARLVVVEPADAPTVSIRSGLDPGDRILASYKTVWQELADLCARSPHEPLRLLQEAVVTTPERFKSLESSVQLNLRSGGWLERMAALKSLHLDEKSRELLRLWLMP